MSTFSPVGTKGVQFHSKFPSNDMCSENLWFLCDICSRLSFYVACIRILHHIFIGKDLSVMYIPAKKCFQMCRWKCLHKFIYELLVFPSGNHLNFLGWTILVVMRIHYQDNGLLVKICSLFIFRTCLCMCMLFHVLFYFCAVPSLVNFNCKYTPPWCICCFFLSWTEKFQASLCRPCQFPQW